MNIKSPVSIKDKLLTALVLQCVVAVLFISHETLVSYVLPYLGWIVLPLSGYFMWQQRQRGWLVLRDTWKNPWSYGLGLLLVFWVFAGLYWQLGALSLTLSLPSLVDAQDTAVYLSLAPKALLHCTLQLSLSMWLLAGCLALSMNNAQRNPSKVVALHWVSEQITTIATITAFYFLTLLLALQCAKTAVYLMGTTQVNVSYAGLFVFFLVMYVFHLMYHFGKQHRQAARNPKKGLAYMFYRTFGFFALAWGTSVLAMYCLPA